MITTPTALTPPVGVQITPVETAKQMLDAVLVTAFVVGATALMTFVTPRACPEASPTSVEGLFAPCLAASRADVRPPDDIAWLYFPSEPGGAMVARKPAVERDIETTGTVTR